MSHDMRSGPHGLAMPKVVQLAKKWQILTGKWLLFVPEWRIDVLWLAYLFPLGFTVRGKIHSMKLRQQNQTMHRVLVLVMWDTFLKESVALDCFLSIPKHQSTGWASLTTEELFTLAAQRLRDGQLHCYQLVVHMPTTDQKKFMISAHTMDFTDQRLISQLELPSEVGTHDSKLYDVEGLCNRFTISLGVRWEVC